jgi:phenylacetate-CoA ligase
MRKRYVRSLEMLRRSLFWGMDALKGAKVKKHLHEIRSALETENPEKTQHIRQRHLDNILSHSKETTPFYQKLSELNSLSDFPVTNKQIINTNYEAFISQPFKKKKNRTVLTSGSTGAPLKIIQDKNKIHRNTADTIYFSELAGYKLGYKLLFLRHWNTYYKKSRVKNWLQNIIPIEVLNLNPNEIKSLIKDLENDPSTKSCLGFPSAFEQICKYLDNIKSPPIDAKIRAIIGMAEGLNDYTKHRMSHYFNAPMVSRYSNMENGILAQQETNDTLNFKINWASYHMEILNLESDIPVNPGEKGRIVVTDLFNYAMPLIRYDTGDIGAIDSQSSPPTLKSVEGRQTDIIYNTKGDIVSSFIMTNIVHYKEMHQIQLIQESAKTYTLKVNGAVTTDLKNQLTNDFKHFLGNDALIDIIEVDEIPLLDSGKRKVTVNNYYNKKRETMNRHFND